MSKKGGWSDFTHFTKNAFTSIQKQVDKVLDIRDDSPDQESDQKDESQVDLKDLTLGTPVVSDIGKHVKDDFFAAFGLTPAPSNDANVLREHKFQGEASNEETQLAEQSTSKWTAAAWSANALQQYASPLKIPIKSSWSSWLGTKSAEDDVTEGVAHNTENLEHEAASNDVPHMSDELVSKHARHDMQTSRSHNLHDNEWNHEDLLVPDLLVPDANRDEGKSLSSYERTDLTDIEENMITPADKRWSFPESQVKLSWLDEWQSRDVAAEPFEDNFPATTAVDAERPSTSRSFCDVRWDKTPLVLSTSFSSSEHTSETMTIPRSTELSESINSSAVVEKSNPLLGCSSIVSSSSSYVEFAAADLLGSKSMHDVEFGDDLIIGHLMNELLMKVCQELYGQPGEPLHSSLFLEGSFVQVGLEQLDDDCLVPDGAPRNSSPRQRRLSNDTGSSAGTVSNSIVKGSGQVSPLEETDIETNATSSDIEILSNPTNGDNMSERSFRSASFAGVDSPLKHQLGHCSQRFRDSTMERRHRRVSSDQGANLLEPSGHSLAQNVGSSSVSSAGSEILAKKIAHLTEVLEVREKKLLDLSRENMQLADENVQLRKEMDTLKLDASSATDTDRLYKAAVKERDALKDTCQRLEKELSSHVDVKKLQAQLKEKDEQISQLAEEGQKLSKQELKHTTIIKKLREKEKENAALFETQKTKLHELDELTVRLKAKDEELRKFDELVYSLKAHCEKQEKQLTSLQSEHEDVQEKCQSYKTMMEKCYRDVAEANKEKAAKEAELQMLKSEFAEANKEDLRVVVEQQRKEKDQERHAMLQQVEDLRFNLVQVNNEYQRREESLKWEISQFQKKLQEAEFRNQDLSESTTSATRPLLRQIENLRASFATQQANWERIEKSLYDRITEAEAQTTLSAEREQQANVAALELRSKVTQLDLQLGSLSGQCQKLKDELAAARTERMTAIDAKHKCEDELRTERALHRKAAEDLQKEKDLLISQFDYERTQLKMQHDERLNEINLALQEKERQVATLREQLFDGQQAASVQSLSRESSTYPIFQRTASPPFSSHALSSSQLFQDDASDDWWSNMEVSASGYSSFVEKLRSRLQQRESDLSILKDELRRAFQTRDATVTELGTVTTDRDSLKEQLEQWSGYKTEYEELNQTYQALLTMYGEKVEENEELKLDLEDVKSMYRTQIEDLLVRLPKS